VIIGCLERELLTGSGQIADTVSILVLPMGAELGGMMESYM